MAAAADLFSLSRRWFRSASLTALRGRHFLPFFDGRVVDASSSPFLCPFHDDDAHDTCSKIEEQKGDRFHHFLVENLTVAENEKSREQVKQNL